MDKWNPPQVKPENGTYLLMLTRGTTQVPELQIMAGVYLAKDDVYMSRPSFSAFTYWGERNFHSPESNTTLVGWMDANDIIASPLGYDPTFGDDRLCECGDPYYRHFDTYEDMYPVGCKYCMHTSGVWQKDKTREHYLNGGKDLSCEETEALHGKCGGFKLAEGQ